ncbi:LacI family DNA-binding transcriptional regulator [Kineococcus sp. NBC_00420]|uniref:LacI family DNA-binding transcriptional regulator n=1 Tax=Kineococcus sp. NBC_00420 TaxID=2903564 RepID=UPI002E1F90F5
MPGPVRRPTVKDVAAEAGVAVMTVSYTFNHPTRVAEATRAKVLEAARRLGYRRPDATARALRSGRNGQIGVVVGEHLSYAFEDPQAALFLAGVADVCVESGTGIVLIPTHGDPAPGGASTSRTSTPSDMVEDVERVLAAPVDGYVLWTTTTDDPVLAAIADSGRPAAIQGGPAHPGITLVGLDDHAAAAAVATALLTTAPAAPFPPAKTSPHAVVPVVLSFPLDHDRQPQVLQGRDLPPDLSTVRFPVTANRLAGYRQALTAHGYRWEDTLIAVSGRNRRVDGRTAATALLDRVDDRAPLLILAMSDELALGALDVLTAAGRTARLTGWDATPAAQAAGITSVTNPLREQGRRCARAVLHVPADDAADDPAWEITTA